MNMKQHSAWLMHAYQYHDRTDIVYYASSITYGQPFKWGYYDIHVVFYSGLLSFLMFYSICKPHLINLLVNRVQRYYIEQHTQPPLNTFSDFF